MKLLEEWVGQDVRDRLDADGRPLGEIASPAYPRSTREAACPYAGGRHGRPMNVTALAQVRPWRDRCLATLASAVGPSPTLAAVYGGLTTIIATPLMLDGPIPAGVSALYKTSVGFHQVVVSLLLDRDGLAEIPAAELGDGDALLTVLEAGGWLVGQRHVCSGAPSEIAGSWDVLTARRTPPDVAPFPLAPLGDWASAATALVIALVLATQARLARAERDDLVGFGDAPKVADWPLGARLWHARKAPWLVSATTRPDRAPSFAARLFVSPPGAVAEFLAREPAAGGHRALEALFWECARGLPARG